MDLFDASLLITSGVCFLSLLGMGMCILSMNKRYSAWKDNLGHVLMLVAVVNALIYLSMVVVIVIGVVSGQ